MHQISSNSMETKSNTIVILVPNLKEIESRKDGFHEI